MEDSFEQPTDTPMREYEFVTLVTDARYITRVNMTRSLVLHRDYQSYTDGDIASVADKGERIKRYTKLPLFNNPPRIILCDTCVTFKERYGTHVDLLEHGGYDITRAITRSHRYHIRQVRAALTYRNDIT